MSNTITTTNFSFPNQKSVYRGKVGKYTISMTIFLVMVATDRLSAFDVVLPGIPYKGQILNQIATKFMELTRYCSELVDCNSRSECSCRTFMCAFQSRNGYSWLHVWSCGREYALGKRDCGVPMPEGLKKMINFIRPLLRQQQSG
jgi:phosphoribosylaminoimidazole-succinocarboxamide synthase